MVSCAVERKGTINYNRTVLPSLKGLLCSISSNSWFVVCVKYATVFEVMLNAKKRGYIVDVVSTLLKY